MQIVESLYTCVTKSGTHSHVGYFDEVSNHIRILCGTSGRNAALQYQWLPINCKRCLRKIERIDR